MINIVIFKKIRYILACHDTLKKYIYYNIRFDNEMFLRVLFTEKNKLYSYCYEK